MLSTLNVHCIEGAKEEEKTPEVIRSKAVIRSGYMYKKSLKQTGVRVGKAWQRRWFVLILPHPPSHSSFWRSGSPRERLYSLQVCARGGDQLGRGVLAPFVSFWLP